MDKQIQLYLGDSKEVLKGIEDNSVDLIVTDPPYQLVSITKRFGKENSKEAQEGKDGSFKRLSKGFMGKEWDVLPPIEVWKECLRVLKPGAFAFIMTTPRQDSLCQILMDLSQAGFVMGFSSIYWSYATGFPKPINIAKAIDKRKGLKGEVVGKGQSGSPETHRGAYQMANQRDNNTFGGEFDITKPQSEEAKQFDGSFGGFQPKPAVEIIIVCMKPITEKTYVDQALKNGKGISWLGDCRIPYVSENEFKKQERGTLESSSEERKYGYKNCVEIGSEKGRFPANLLVSDDVLNDGKISKGGGVGGRGKHTRGEGYGFKPTNQTEENTPIIKDEGSYSRYFDLDIWWEKQIDKLPEDIKKVFPFLIVPKASKSEKNKGCELKEVKKMEFETTTRTNKETADKLGCERKSFMQNNHPTVKPIKLMSYLITLGSRENDVILDPFMGSGTTGIACKLLNRKFIGIEMSEEYMKIAQERIKGNDNK